MVLVRGCEFLEDLIKSECSLAAENSHHSASFCVTLNAPSLNMCGHVFTLDHDGAALNSNLKR